MKTEVKDLGNWKKSILIEEDVESINNEVNEKIKEYAKKINLPGFRPGKVPVSIVKKRYGASIEAEVLDNTINNCYTKALKDNSIEPIHQYPIENDKLKFDKEKGLSFEVVVEVQPEIEVKDYKGHGITPKRVQVTKKRVSEEIDRLREQYAEYIEVEREAKEGDWAVVDYKALEDGDVEDKKDYRVKLVKNEKGEFDKFVESIIGKKAGDNYVIDYKFPKEAPGNLSEKEVKFEISVVKIEESKLPELDKEFLEKVQAESVDDLEAKIKESISESEKNRAKDEAFNKIIDYIIEKNNFEVPQSMIDNYIKNKMKELKLEDESLKDTFKEEAEKEVKKYLILDAIAKQEKIKASSKDVDAKIEEIASMYGLEADVLKDGMRKRGEVLRLREDLKIEKTIDFLIDNAK